MRAPVSLLLAVALLLPGAAAWAAPTFGPAPGNMGAAQLQQHNEMMRREATWRQRLMERLRALWARRPFQGKPAMEEMKKQYEKTAELMKRASERVGLGRAGDPGALSPAQRLEQTRNGQPPRTPWTVTGGFGKFIRRAGSDIRMDQDSPVVRRSLIARVASSIKTMAQSFRRKLGPRDQAQRPLQPAVTLAPSGALARRTPGVFRRTWERITGRADGHGVVRRSWIRRASARLDGAAGADLIKLRSLPDEARRAELLRKADRLRQQGYRDMATIFETVATFRASDFEKLCLAFLVRRNREEFERGTARTRRGLRERRADAHQGRGQAPPRFRLVQASQ